MLASGTAWTAEIPKPLAHIAPKPASSTRRAERASCAPPARTIRDPRRSGNSASPIPLLVEIRFIADGIRTAQGLFLSPIHRHIPVTLAGLDNLL